MVEPYSSLPPSLRSPHRSLLALRHPLPLLPEGGDYRLHLFNYYSFLALSRFGKSTEFEI